MNRPTRDVQFALSERVAHLDGPTWDALTKDAGVFLQRPFLQALEAAAPVNLAPRYALMYLDGQAIAALCLQVVRVDGRSAGLGGVARWVDERAIVLGNLAAWDATGLAIADGADAGLVWREALRLVDRLRRFEKADGAVNVSFVKDAAREEDEAALRRQGYQRAPTGPDLVLKVDPAWTSLDAYLASLAAKRRRAVKKTLEQVAAAGYRVRRLTADDVAAHADRIDALYGQVWSAADVHPVRLSGRFFAELQRRLGDDCATVGLEKDGRLDGFGVTLKSADGAVGYYLGYDKDVDAPLYLRLLISILEQGFAWRAARISMGRTAEETKQRLGAEPGPFGLWVKHRTPPVNWAVGAILGTIQPPPVATHRAFREEA